MWTCIVLKEFQYKHDDNIKVNWCKYDNDNWYATIN